MFYLKYRPKTVEDLDNSNVKETLSHILSTAAQKKTIPHAFLFTGQKGTGKTSTARIMAKAVNCLNNAFASTSTPSNSTKENSLSIEPCNNCSNCKSIENGSSPDVVEMDAASNRGIDEVRSLIHDASFAPITTRYRVFIIDEAHMITNDAFNALLKTLEEPPQSVLFILATTNEEKVPKTIISRCTRVLFGKAKQKDILRRLQKIVANEKITVDPDVLKFVSEHAESSFRDANKILEELITQNKLTLEDVKNYVGLLSHDNFLQILTTTSLKETLEWIQNFTQNGGSIKYLIEESLETLRIALLAKSGITTEEAPDLNLTVPQISSLMRLLNEAYGMLRTSPIESIPLEIAVVEFYNKKKV